MFSRFKSISIGFMLVFMLLIISACSDNNSSGGGTVNPGDPDKPVDPDNPDYAHDFYLGTMFTIKSLGSETFTSVSSSPLNYKATDINSASITSATIVDELKTDIAKKLESKNIKSKVVIGSDNIKGDVKPNDTLVITIPATITEIENTGNTETVKYIFRIEFHKTVDGWNGEVEEIIPVESGKVYEIHKASHLAWIAKESFKESNPNNFKDKVVRFMNHVDMNDIPFTGIKSFAGRMEGNLKIIYKLNIDKGMEDNAGLVNTLEEQGYIDNLTIASGIIKGNSHIGAFIGTTSGLITLKDVKNNATVEGIDSFVGGLAGHVIGGSITDSSNSGIVNGLSRIGGLVGESHTEILLSIDNSSNTGTVTGTGADGQIGGFVGGSSANSVLNIHNGFNSGRVTGSGVDDSVGGFVGLSDAVLVIDNSSNIGTISGGRYAGGLIGYSDTVTLSISNSSNVGDIVSVNYAGGIVGYNYRTTTFTNVYSYAKITTSNISKSGGIVGFIDSTAVLTATNSYWLHDGAIGVANAVGEKSNGSSFAGNSQSLNKEKFKVKTTFSGWDFTDNTGIWIMGTEYPTLRNLPKP